MTIDLEAIRLPVVVFSVSSYFDAPTALGRAGGVQRNAAPNLFQTLIEATADVR